jgi:sialate O-acetylesterase
MPTGLLPEHRPGYVFNAMVHPLLHTAIRGVLWYQGESNSGRAADYADLFRALIEGWRAAFHQPALPFLFVQLPNLAGGGDWPFLREAQEQALALPGTARAVTLDVGESIDIHPHHKQPVGERLANLALREVYAQPVQPYSPTVAEVRAGGSELRLQFRHAAGGLRTTDGKAPRGFEICGPDGAYQPADARLDDDGVLLTHPAVPAPAGVRYAFRADPDINLVNAEGLPAAPFRRDPPA